MPASIHVGMVDQLFLVLLADSPPDFLKENMNMNVIYNKVEGTKGTLGRGSYSYIYFLLFISFFYSALSALVPFLLPHRMENPY